MFKTRIFARWATRQGLSDVSLASAVSEIERGIIDARLGGQVVKKRVAISGGGIRGGTRTLIAFKKRERSFFIYGFAKNERANVGHQELKALRLLARELLGLTESELAFAVHAGELIEIEKIEDG